MPLSATEIQLRVLQTADIHMFLSDYDFFRGEANATQGLVRTASLIKVAKAEVKNAILVDNGDLIQGNPLGDYRVDRFQTDGDLQQHPLTKVMTHLNYDVGNIGNHEFNYGLPYLEALVGTLPFPYVCANVFRLKDNTPLFTPFVVLERKLEATNGSMHDLKIGVIGVVPPQIMNWDKAKLEHEVRVIDIRDAVREQMPLVKAAGADLVIVVAHSGIEKTEAETLEENAVVGITKIAGVNAVLAGHHHAVFPGPKYAHIPGADLEKGTINGVPVVMPGFWGSHLGLVDFHLKQHDDAWEVVDFKVENRAISKREGAVVTALVEADAEIAALLEKDVKDTREWLKKPVGKIASPVESFFSLVADSSAVQLVQDAQSWYVKEMIKGTELEYYPVLSAAAPFRVGYPDKDAYVDIAPGDFSLRDSAEIYLYPNTIVVLKFTSAQIKEYLERAATMFVQIDLENKAPQSVINSEYAFYNFDMIDGITYQIDVSQPARYDVAGLVVNPEANRIENLRWRNVPLREGQEFLVVTNSYRAYGGGNFPGASVEHVVMEAPDLVRDVIVRYIRSQEHGVSAKPDHNWALKPQQEVKLIYESSPSASALKAAGRLGHVTPLEEKNAEGYLKYQLTWQKWIELPKVEKKPPPFGH